MASKKRKVSSNGINRFRKKTNNNNKQTRLTIRKKKQGNTSAANKVQYITHCLDRQEFSQQMLMPVKTSSLYIIQIKFQKDRAGY